MNFAEKTDSELLEEIECFSFLFSKNESHCMACLVRDRCIDAIVTSTIPKMQLRNLGVAEIADALSIDVSTVSSVIIPRMNGAELEKLLPAPAQQITMRTKKRAPRVVSESDNVVETPVRKKALPKQKVEVDLSTVKAPRISSVERRIQWEAERKKSEVIANLQIPSHLSREYQGHEIKVIYADGYVEFRGQKWPSLYYVVASITGKRAYPTKDGKERLMSDWSVARFFRL